MWNISLIHFSSVAQSCLFVNPWTAAHQAFLSITNSRSLLKLIESVMPSNHLTLCCPLLFLPSSQWCPPTISSSVVPFSSCLRSFPTSGSFPRSQFFASGDQSIGVSASTSVFPMNSEDWFPLGLTGFKAMVFPVVMYGCESWTTKKAEHRRTDAFELWWYILVNTYWVSDSFWVLDYLFVQDK